MANIKDIHGNPLSLSASDILIPSLGVSLAEAITQRLLPVPDNVTEQVEGLESKVAHAVGTISSVTVDVATDDTGTTHAEGEYQDGVLAIKLYNVKGDKGDDGKSAYRLAVENGFNGTEAEWLESIKGVKGNDGKSTYEIAIKNGFTGTEAEWLEVQKGADGHVNVVQSINASDTANAPSSKAVADYVAAHTGQSGGNGIYPYFGERIQVKTYRYSRQLLMTETNSSSSSNQGAACYGKYLFQCHNTNDVIDVFNLDTKTKIQTITLTKDTKHHCNNANFGAEFASVTDDFPLLYISQEHADRHRCLVYRITGSEGSWGASLVQTITFPTPSDDFLWYPNSLIDTQNKKLIVAGLGNNPWSPNKDNILRYKVFALPLLAEGNVTLDIANIVDSIEVKYYSTCQGGFVFNNKIYEVFGMNNTAQLNVIDLDTHKVISEVDITGDGIVDEPESCFIYNNKICVNFIDGKIYQFDF